MEKKYFQGFGCVVYLKESFILIVQKNLKMTEHQESSGLPYALCQQALAEYVTKQWLKV